MCGIAGTVGHAPQLTISEMVTSLTHRGPDSGGLRAFADCHIGMRRLRVVDLRPEADQPMRGETDDVWLVYNGELYNHVELRRELEGHGHVFRSRSDTEVIVHGYEQWGDGVVERLRGMFAFAVWDDPRRRLLLARDRLGIKPLYLCDQLSGLAFASEAHALGRRPVSRHAVASYLRLGWVGAGATIGEGVRELPPGHFLVHEDGAATITRYWAPVWREEALNPERLAAALEDSVSRHLVADVPVGVFLSSGVDSTVVAALAARHDRDVRTYTVAFDEGSDEVEPAAELARAMGTSHEVVHASGSGIAQAMPQIVAAMDQPTVDGVNSWLICGAVRQAGITVALSGLGGDELFRGYSTFTRVPQVAAVGARVPRALLRGVERAAGLSERTAHGRLRRAGESAALGGLPAAYAGVRGLFGWSQLYELWWGGRETLRSLDDAALLAPGCTVGDLELGNYLRYQLLRDTDVMSMAHSLEVRVPLLDDDVVEAALVTLPALNGLHGKQALAHAGGRAAVEAAQRPKLTFTLPFDRWLHGDLRPWAEDSLSALAGSEFGFDANKLSKLLTAYDSGHLQWRPLWALCVLGAWLDQH